MGMIRKLRGRPGEAEEGASEAAEQDLVQEVQVSSGSQAVVPGTKGMTQEDAGHMGLLGGSREDSPAQRKCTGTCVVHALLRLTLTSPG